MIRVVIADDHHLVRHGLRLLLERAPDIQVVAEAADGLEAMQQLEAYQPDVIVLDLMLPAMHGIEVIRQARERFPRTRFLVLSMHADEGYVAQALQSGADGYVLKTSSASDLVEAVRMVHMGGRYLSPAIDRRLIDLYESGRDTQDLDAYRTLTARERVVLQLVAEGRTNREIALLLGISPRTVETHRANLMRKLGLETQADVVRYAIRKGLIPLEE